MESRVLSILSRWVLGKAAGRWARVACEGLLVAMWASAPAHAMPAPGDLEIVDPTVSESSGASTFRIAIAVPPGPRNLAPALALVYSSHAGDGPYGLAWRLSIESEIRCTARFGVPDYGACPRYELDDQLLTHASGSRYHPFVETFQRIEKLADHWEVTSTDGTVRRYGTSDNSRIHAVGTSGPVARFLLDEIRDTFGNTIAITYERLDAGTAYPQTITYAGGERKVTFVYETRPDPIHDFAGGVARQVTKRLREVQVTSGTSPVHVYQRHVFGYDSLAPAVTYSTARSRLAWRQVFGTDCDLGEDPLEDCTGLPPETFTYTDPNDALTTAQAAQYEPAPGFWYQPLLVAKPPPNLFGDVDGDGLVDRIYWFDDNNPTTDPGPVHLNTGSGGRGLDDDVPRC